MTGEAATADWGSELTHILVVRDIAPAVAFYRDVLGATVVREYGAKAGWVRIRRAVRTASTHSRRSCAVER